MSQPALTTAAQQGDNPSVLSAPCARILIGPTGTGGVKVAASSRNGGKRQRRLTLRLTLRRRTDRQQRPLRLQLRRRRQEPGRGQRREERRQGRPDAWRRRRRAWRSKGKRSRYSVATPSYDFFLSASLNHEKCLPGAATTTARSTP